MHNSKSSYFDGLFKYAVSDDEPLELSIDSENFQLLYEWLRAPSPTLFSKMEFKRILSFMEAVCQYDISELEKQCKESLKNLVSFENVFSLLEQLYLFHKKNKQCGILFNFSDLEDTVITILRVNHSLSLSGSEIRSWLLNPEKEIQIEFLVKKEVRESLLSIQDISLFKESNIKLNIKNLKQLTILQKNLLLSCFPKMTKIILDFDCKEVRKKSDKNITGFTSKINWDFLTKFENLKEVSVELPKNITNELVATISEEFPRKAEWQIFFDLKNYMPTGYINRPFHPVSTVSIDNFIRLSLMESQTKCTLPKQFRPYITDCHLQTLIDAEKFDFESPRLDLTALYHTSGQFVDSIVKKMTNLEELKLDFSNTSLFILYNAFPHFASRLKKLSLSLEYFHASVGS